MSEQAIGQPHRRLPFLRLPRALRASIENALLKIDIAATDRWLERRAADRSVAGAGVEADQDEPRNVATDVARGVLSRIICLARHAAQSSGGFRAVSQTSRPAVLSGKTTETLSPSKDLPGDDG